MNRVQLQTVHVCVMDGCEVCAHIHVDLDCYIKQTTVTIIILYRVATELLYITKVSIACSQ